MFYDGGIYFWGGNEMKKKIRICFGCAAVLYGISALIAKIFELNTSDSIFASIVLFVLAIPIELGLYFTSVYLRKEKRSSMYVAVYFLMCLVCVAMILSCIVFPIVFHWR